MPSFANAYALGMSARWAQRLATRFELGELAEGQDLPSALLPSVSASQFEPEAASVVEM